jgi:hypothetical protein
MMEAPQQHSGAMRLSLICEVGARESDPDFLLDRLGLWLGALIIDDR